MLFLISIGVALSVGLWALPVRCMVGVFLLALLIGGVCLLIDRYALADTRKEDDVSEDDEESSPSLQGGDRQERERIKSSISSSGRRADRS